MKLILRLLLVLMMGSAFAQISQNVKEGEDYRVLASSQPLFTKDKIEVIEFFWYGCPHCYDFQPELKSWLNRQNKDIVYKKIPIAFREQFFPHSQIFYALESMGIGDTLTDRIMFAVHRENKRLLDESEILEWLSAQGVDRNKFLAAYRSSSVLAKAVAANQLGNSYRIDGIPTIAIQGKYITSPSIAGSKIKAINTMDFLVDLVGNSNKSQTQYAANSSKLLQAEVEEAKRRQADLEQQLRLAQNQMSANTSQPSQPPPVINQGRRVALVIGNALYSSVPQLINPTNDAREVTRALQATGFEVIRLENADLRQMQDAVRSFGNKLGKNDVGLFYFSGHGVQVKGKNYLIPVRENIKKSFEVPSSAIDADLILATMENAKNNLNIMILDACRSPFPGEARSLSRGLATLDAAKGTLIAYATAPGKEALDGQGSNSPYTKHLVRALQQKGLPIEQVFKQVRIAVVEETKGNQVPWENSSIMGDFYFRK